MSEKMRQMFFLFLATILIVGCKREDSSCNSKTMEQQTNNATKVTMGGKTFYTCGRLPKVGEKAPDFILTANDLTEKSLSKDYLGKNVVLNIFPSIDTKVCAQSVRTFNKDAANLNNTIVLCISKDLPFAQTRFCAAEGIENVITLSDFRHSFGEVYGVELTGGPLKGLLSRAVVVIDPEGKIIYEEQVSDIGHEPNYAKALSVIGK